MPLFHSNALMAGWGPALMAGSAFALPASGRFSASGFLPDVRAAGATYFNYVGKPLSFILATPEQPDDADNPLVRAFGNEGTTEDVARFAERFGVAVTDAYGSTEGGATVQRTPDTPPGALGRAPEGTVVLDPDDRGRVPARPLRRPAAGCSTPRRRSAKWCPRRAAPASRATGATARPRRARLREGWYWTGDLAYRDEAGFFYFAGRDHDWLRVDGENFASAPIERILQRHPDIVLASVYAVPDPVVGDQVMAAVQLRPGLDVLDAADFAAFLAAQGDLGTKWAPRFVRMSAALPATATNKVLKRSLRAERWNCAEPVLWQSEKGGPYRRSDRHRGGGPRGGRGRPPHLSAPLPVSLRRYHRPPTRRSTPDDEGTESDADAYPSETGPASALCSADPDPPRNGGGHDAHRGRRPGQHRRWRRDRRVRRRQPDVGRLLLPAQGRLDLP